MADSSTQPQQSGNGGMGITGAILNILSQTALGAATGGESEAKKQEIKQEGQQESQMAAHSALLNLMGSMAEKGIDPSSLGINPTSLGLDPQTSTAMTGILSKVATQAQTRSKVAGAALGKMDPSLAPLAQIPGMAEALLPGAIKLQGQQQLQGQKQQFAAGEDDKKIKAAEGMTQARIGASENIATMHDATARGDTAANIASREHVAAINNHTKLFIAQHKNGAVTSSQLAGYMKSMTSTFEKITKGSGADPMPETGEALNTSLRSMRDQQLNSGIPIGHLWDTLPFSVPIKTDGWVGASVAQAPQLGVMNAFTAAITDPNDKAQFSQLTMKLHDPIKAAQTMVQAGKMDPDAYKAILSQIQDDVNSSTNATPGGLLADDPDGEEPDDSDDSDN